MTGVQTCALPICFYVWDQQADKLVRKRIGIRGNSIEEREKTAKEIVEELNRRLKIGLVTNPIIEEETGISKKSSLKRALEFFLEIKSATLSGRSSETYTSCANTFLEFCNLNGVTDKHVGKFADELAHQYTDWIILQKKLSNKSHNKLKGFVSSFFNNMVKRKIVDNNPFAFIPSLPETTGMHRVFDASQIAQFKQLCLENEDLGTLFFASFIYYTFMRPHQEIRLMQVGDIRQTTVVVRETNAKTNRIRHVLIPPGLEILLQQHEVRRYPPHFYVFSYNGVPGIKAVSENYWWQRHVKYMKIMELFGNDYDLYGWKHTGVTALYRATKDLKLVQEQCGHTDIKQTVEYLRDLGVFYYEGQIQKMPTI